MKRVRAGRQAGTAADALVGLALVARQLFHLALQLRVHIASSVLALDVNSHLLETNFDPLLERLHRLVDSRAVHNQRRFQQRNLQREKLLQLRHEAGVFRMLQQIAVGEKGLFVIVDASVDGRVDDAVELHAERMQRQFGIGPVSQNQFRQRFVGLFHRLDGRLQRTQFKNVGIDDGEPSQNARQLVRRGQDGPFQPETGESVVRIALAAMERPGETEALDAVDAVEAQNLLADRFAGEPLLVFGAEHRVHLVHLQVLLRRVHDLLIRRSQPVHRFGVGELQHDAVGEIAQTLVLFTAEDKDLVLQEGRESASVESHPEVFRLGSELVDYVVVERGHASQEGTESTVVVSFLFVLVGQLLAEGQGAFPHFATVEEIDAVQVQGFFQLAVGRGERVARRQQQRGQRLVVPAQQLGVQLKRVGRLGEIVAFQMQVAEFVEVSDVHFFATDFLVEIEQVHRATHPVLTVLVRDDGSVFQETLH